METKSFKQMIQAGEVKRADAMKVRLDDIHEEPGFNLRIEGAELEESIDQLTDHVLRGGILPPLEVRPRKDGGVFVVDGHRRRRAMIRARERGAPIEWVNVVAFTGNDADRVTRIITSAEGKPLSQVEIAAGYKRLAAFGLSADEIAGRVGKTRQHVDQLMILANAPTSVQKMVAAGDVSAAVAVKVARAHGDDAGQVLKDELNKAKAAGKGKVTPQTMQGKPLPPKVVGDMVDCLESFIDVLPNETRQQLAVIETADPHSVPETMMVSVPAKSLMVLVFQSSRVAEAKAKLEAKARAKANKAKQRELA